MYMLHVMIIHFGTAFKGAPLKYGCIFNTDTSARPQVAKVDTFYPLKVGHVSSKDTFLGSNGCPLSKEVCRTALNVTTLYLCEIIYSHKHKFLYSNTMYNVNALLNHSFLNCKNDLLYIRKTSFLQVVPKCSESL